MLRKSIASIIILILTSSFTMAYGLENDPKVPITDFSLVNLQNNERLEVIFGSQGCFHSDTAKIIFEDSIVRIGSLGARDLSWKELRKIENYFVYVDNLKTPGGCTTVTTMTLKRVINGKVVAQKTLIDATCGYRAEGKDEMMSPGKLYYDLQRQDENMTKWSHRK